MVGRLLGHRRAATTNRYAHLDDVTLSEAAERMAIAIKQKIHHTECWELARACSRLQ